VKSPKIEIVEDTGDFVWLAVGTISAIGSSAPPDDVVRQNEDH
jgi:hypothetical protein